MKNLYYVVEKQTTPDGDEFEYVTGRKDISLYEIVDNTPKLLINLSADNSDSSTGEIQNWLNENGIGYVEYNLIQL